MLLLLVPALASAAPTLTVGGTCPGPVDLDIAGATPNGRLVILSADDQGTAPLPGGPCAEDTGLSSAGLTVRKVLTADGTGRAGLTPNLPGGVCGAWIQVVDVSACTLSGARQLPVTGCNLAAVELLGAINDARQDEGLLPVPMSSSMCHVSQTHSDDQDAWFSTMGPECNLHSWSDQGPWTPCCYTSDHAQAQCMWDKPRELTDYLGTGYEISAAGYPSAQAAVNGWLNSPGHADVILNQGVWANLTWRAVGGGEAGGYWNVWFGEEVDPGWP